MRACVRACVCGVRACVCACVGGCVRVCVCVRACSFVLPLTIDGSICHMVGLYWLLRLILYHPADCDGVLAVHLCLSVCFCVFAIMTPHSNANSHPQ